MPSVNAFTRTGPPGRSYLSWSSVKCSVSFQVTPQTRIFWGNWFLTTPPKNKNKPYSFLNTQREQSVCIFQSRDTKDVWYDHLADRYQTSYSASGRSRSRCSGDSKWSIFRRESVCTMPVFWNRTHSTRISISRHRTFRLSLIPALRRRWVWRWQRAASGSRYDRRCVVPLPWLSYAV